MRFLLSGSLVPMLVLLLLGPSSSYVFAEGPIPLPEMLEDAELNSVHFVDADRGWAVGDRGAIWNTNDGGRSWRVQLSPTSAGLTAVHFLDGENGCAVGGWTQPYTHRSTGVVLRTRDGGLQWTAVPDLTLPALRWVKFIDKRRGWAAGESSAMYPTGVFWTSDGGRSWLPVPRGPALSWQSGDLGADGMPVLLTADGRIARASFQEVRLLDAKGSASPTQALQLDRAGAGCCVGDSGRVRLTNDHGNTWQPPVGQLPPAVANIDFRGCAIKDKNIWLIGDPGSVVVRSADGGKSWDYFHTDNPTPLRSFQFLDENRGWAVGSLGVILATRDGGRTWLTQHRGGKQAALLGIFSEPNRVPWEWFAQYSGNEAYLSALEIISHRSERPLTRQLTALRTHEALVAIGGSTATTSWQFPLPSLRETPQADAILKSWNERHNGRGFAVLEERLVRKLRVWRPEVVFTEDVSPRGDDPQGHLLNQAVLAAVQQAADPAIYPEHAADLGLASWKVKKVVTHLAGERRGVLTLAPSQLAPRLGKSLAEAAEAGRAILSERQQVSPATLSAGILIDSLPQGMGRQDLFSGISVRPGGEARRKLSDPVGGSLDSLTRLTQKRHNIQQLIARTAGDSAQAATWLGQVTELTAGMSERAAGEVLYQLGTRYQQAGKHELTADAFVMLIDRNPQHPLSEPAALWLLKYYASCEVAWRLQNEQKYNVQVTSFESAVDGKTPDDPEAKSPAIGPNISAPNVKTLGTAGHDTTAVKSLRMTERANKALAIGKMIERIRPAFYAEPSFRFPLTVASRNLQAGKTGDKPFESLLSLGADHPWSAAIAAENWLPQMRGNPTNRIVKIIKAAKPPVLDGRMDDEVWQSTRAVTLVPASDRDTAATRVVLAYDEEYLYVAASCRRSTGLEYAPSDKPRLHDAIPTNTDRLQLTFDLDRDYATGFQFTIDHAGRLAENCFGDLHWNPNWFVAAAGDDLHWTTEVAIPRAELTPQAPQTKDVWNIAVERLIPNLGRQSLAAEDEQASDYRLLVFE